MRGAAPSSRAAMAASPAPIAKTTPTLGRKSVRSARAIPVGTSRLLTGRIAIAAHNLLGARALLYYLIPYAAISIGALAVVAARER